MGGEDRGGLPDLDPDLLENRGGFPDLDPDLLENRGGLPDPDPDLLESRDGLPELIKFSRQVGKSRGKSGKVGEIPTFPDFLLKIGKSRDVTRLSSIFPDFSRLFPVFLT